MTTAAERPGSEIRTMHRGLAGLALALLPIGLGTANARGQEWRTVAMSRQLQDERSLDVEVRYAAGRFGLAPAEPGTLYRMHLRYDEDALAPVARHSGSRLVLGAEAVGSRMRLAEGETAGEIRLELTPDVPIDLDLDLGAVKAEIDLGSLRLTGLDIETGASQTGLEVSEPNTEAMAEARLRVGAAQFTARGLGNLNASRIEVDAGVADLDLDLTGEWRQDATVTVDVGFGALTLRLPRGIGVRLSHDGFLTSLDSEGLVKRGDAYYSLDYEEAEYQVHLDVDAAFGRIRIVWVADSEAGDGKR